MPRSPPAAASAAGSSCASVRPTRRSLARGASRCSALRVPALHELAVRDPLCRRWRRRRRRDGRPAAGGAGRAARAPATTVACSAAGCATSGLRRAAGRIEGVCGGRAVESWFFPSARDDPFAYIHVRDEPAPGVPPGTRVTVPSAADRLPADGRLRTLVCQLVQLRPVLEDPQRELWLELPSGAVESCARPCPSPTPSGRCCSTTRSRSRAGRARARHRPAQRAGRCRPGMSRATRRRRTRGALGPGRARVDVRRRTRARPARAASTARCAATRSRTCSATRSRRPRPQVVVRSIAAGSTTTTPSSVRSTPRSSGVLRPIVAAEERRARSHLVRPAARCSARDQVGLRALNDALKGRVRHTRQGRLRARRRRRRPGRRSSDAPTARRMIDSRPGAPAAPGSTRPDALQAVSAAPPPRRAARRLAALRPGAVPPGTPISRRRPRRCGVNLWADHGCRRPSRGGWSRVPRRSCAARVSADPGSRLSVPRRSRRPRRRARRAGRASPRKRLGARDRAQGRGRRGSRRTSTRRAAP